MDHPFDFREGEVTHCSWEIDESISLARQLWELRQDLIQVEYEKQHLALDIGWYPDFNQEGCFVLYVVRNQDWESPLIRREAFTVADLRQCVSEVVDAIATL